MLMTEAVNEDAKVIIQCMDHMRVALKQIAETTIFEMNTKKANQMKVIAVVALKECEKLLFPEPIQEVKSEVQ